ncbi:MAG TPA: ATP synthase subunit I [Methylomirabilota bacterium]|nr:ATP synthase subunit I [Methylomirabilota bacterium]
MTATELTARVTVTTAIAVLPLALAGAWLGGLPGALGVLAGGLLALGSFRALAARAAAATASTAWLLTAGLRFAGVTAVAAVLFVQGWAHPLAVLAGYTILPVIVIAHGLRLARESASWM